MHKQSLRDLWADELNDLWSAEQEMLDALPDAGSRDAELREVFRQHQARAESHLERLREIFVAETLAQRSKARAARQARRPARRPKRADRSALGADA